MKQIAIREFQKRFYRILDEELPVLITVTAKRKGEKVKTVKRCFVIPYDERIEADYDKIELYKKPPEVETPAPLTAALPINTDPQVIERNISVNGNPVTVAPVEEKKKGFFGLFKK